MRPTATCRALAFGLLLSFPGIAFAEVPNDPPKSPAAEQAPAAREGKKPAGAAQRKARLEQQAARLEASAAKLRTDGKAEQAARLEARAKQLRASADKPARRGNPKSPDAERARKKFTRVKALRKRYGKALDQAPVQQELSTHAERTVRLRRMKRLAEESGKSELVARIETLRERENQRHAERLKALMGEQADVPAAASAEDKP
jgi:hypothetical protein